MNNVLRRSRATGQQYCLCNVCNGAVLMSYAGRKRHKNVHGLSTTVPERLVPEGHDEEDEDGARQRVTAERVLRDILERSDDEEVDLLGSYSPTSTPPRSEFGGDEQDEEGPRVDGGFAGPDQPMDTMPGVLAPDLESNGVRWKIQDWLAGAATALLISTWLCLMPYSVSYSRSALVFRYYLARYMYATIMTRLLRQLTQTC